MEVKSEIIPGQIVEGRHYPDTLYITGMLEKSEVGAGFSVELNNQMRKLLPERFNHLEDKMVMDYRDIGGRSQITWIVSDYDKYK